MELFQVVSTAVATLGAVMLGGWLTLRAQDRLWERDHARQWRDIRLAQYQEFLAAFREYVAYVQLSTTHVETSRRQRSPHDLMPHLDADGLPYQERLDSTKTAVRLVSEHHPVVEASRRMVRLARSLAVERATQTVEQIPAERFDALWEAERGFVRRARDELGLNAEFDVVEDHGPQPQRGGAQSD